MAIIALAPRASGSSQTITSLLPSPSPTALPHLGLPFAAKVILGILAAFLICTVNVLIYGYRIWFRRSGPRPRSAALETLFRLTTRPLSHDRDTSSRRRRIDAFIIDQRFPVQKYSRVARRHQRFNTSVSSRQDIRTSIKRPCEAKIEGKDLRRNHSGVPPDGEECAKQAINVHKEYNNSEPSSHIADMCSVCLETFADEDNVRLLTCYHLFHATCLDPWFTDRSTSCPLCKRDYYISPPKVEKKVQEERSQS